MGGTREQLVVGVVADTRDGEGLPREDLVSVNRLSSSSYTSGRNKKL